MNYAYSIVSFQEVPDEVSLSILISGCQHKCRGCHSSRVWRPDYGKPLSKDTLSLLLKENDGYITCVNFLGGEWEDDFIEYVKLVKDTNLKVCLYTGLDKMIDLDDQLLKLLDYVKVGKYNRDMGGLNSSTTNQRMYKQIDKNVFLDITEIFYK